MAPHTAVKAIAIISDHQYSVLGKKQKRNDFYEMISIKFVRC